MGESCVTSKSLVSYLLLIIFNIGGRGEDFAAAEKVTIGAIFEAGTTEQQTAFKYAMSLSSSSAEVEKRGGMEFHPVVNILDTQDTFKLSRMICHHFQRGVVGMVGVMKGPESANTFHSFMNQFNIPFITTHPLKLGSSSGEFATTLVPSFSPVILDTIHYYGWKSIIYLYCSNEGLQRLQHIFQDQGFSNESLKLDVVRQVGSVEQVLDLLYNIDMANSVEFMATLMEYVLSYPYSFSNFRFGPKHIVLDCPLELCKEVITQHVQQVRLSSKTHHYLITGLGMEEPWEDAVVEYGSVNVTGFRLVNPNRRVVREFLSKWNALDKINFPSAGRPSISPEGALMFDAVSVLAEAFSKMSKKVGILKVNVTRGEAGACTGTFTQTTTPIPFEMGERISKYIRKVELDGLTGPIKFTEEGRRMNFSIDVMEMTVHSKKVKIAEWSDTKGFLRVPPKYTRPPKFSTFQKNRTYIVTSIIEEPYMIYNTTGYHGEELTGNDRFSGFCKDLADKIAETLGISYELRMVKDEKYGKEDIYGQWDGMVGELVRRESDIVIAPLTISSERERVIEFSKPFMSLGISIMVYKPKKISPSVFSFMSPLSNEIWLCVCFAFIGVSIVLYLVSRFNPNEWKESNASTTASLAQSSVSNDPIWFSLAALLQQGSDTSPKSSAGRIVGAVWWFFTLILISSYTANFAAVRTVNRMVTPINSAEDLAAQTDVEYGTLAGGSTWNFFRRSQMPVYSKMWDFMNTRQQINLAVLSMKESGTLMQMQSKWWEDRTECPTEEKESADTDDELSLQSLSGIFYILLSGLGLAVVLALLEFCWSTGKEANKRKISLQEAIKLKAKMRIKGQGEEGGESSTAAAAAAAALGGLSSSFVGYSSSSSAAGVRGDAVDFEDRYRQQYNIPTCQRHPHL